MNARKQGLEKPKGACNKSRLNVNFKSLWIEAHDWFRKREVKLHLVVILFFPSDGSIAASRARMTFHKKLEAQTASIFPI